VIVRRGTTNGQVQNFAVADCGVGNHAIGGGGVSGNVSQLMYSTFPSGGLNAAQVAPDSSNPRFWAAVFNGPSDLHTAWAVCVPN
jgi:hypothetical protein